MGQRQRVQQVEAGCDISPVMNAFVLEVVAAGSPVSYQERSRYMYGLKCASLQVWMPFH